MVHSCNGACLGLIYIISGDIRVSMFSEEGRELTLFKLGASETCVISAACVLHEIKLESSMTASSDTTVMVLNSKTLAYLVSKNTEVKYFCYEIALRRFKSAFFVMQEEIATEVNLAREVVARMLKQFELEGLVELKRGAIELKDLDGIRAII